MGHTGTPSLSERPAGGVTRPRGADGAAGAGVAAAAGAGSEVKSDCAGCGGLSVCAEAGAAGTGDAWPGIARVSGVGAAVACPAAVDADATIVPLSAGEGPNTLARVRSPRSWPFLSSSKVLTTPTAKPIGPP